jgi:hypothetical protein
LSLSIASSRLQTAASARETVRGALSRIPGSLDADFAAERNERLVPGYFIDTSAPAKLFRAEVGRQQMEMLAQPADNRLTVSQLSVI